jgi:two-component system response regulator HydG
MSEDTLVRGTVLVVDDDRDVRTFFERVVGGLGAEIELLTAEDLGQARTLIASSQVALAFVDKGLPDGDGVDFCRELLERSSLAAYVITGSGSSVDCLAALQSGVQGYIPKPFAIQTIRDVIRRHVLVSEEDSPVGEPVGKRMAVVESDYHIIGESPQMIEIAAAIQRIAQTDAAVVVSGLSGTGKEVIAKQIHLLSKRRGQKFVAVNCGAIPAELIESELFGHEKGAFTDARNQRIGLFEEADGGTIFLDEIVSTPTDFQVKLLRVLQEGVVRRLGSNREISLDVRVIAASNRELETEIREGRFREDLYFRLKGAEIHLPPLRDRRKDIMPLARHFGDRAAARNGKTVHFSRAVVDALENYYWPGNVRQLESVIEYAIARCNETMLTSDLPREVREFFGETSGFEPPLVTRREDVVSLSSFMDRYAADVLRLYSGNKSQAANALDIDRKWFIAFEDRQKGNRSNRRVLVVGDSRKSSSNGEREVAGETVEQMAV